MRFLILFFTTLLLIWFVWIFVLGTNGVVDEIQKTYTISKLKEREAFLKREVEVAENFLQKLSADEDYIKSIANYYGWVEGENDVIFRIKYSPQTFFLIPTANNSKIYIPYHIYVYFLILLLSGSALFYFSFRIVKILGGKHIRVERRSVYDTFFDRVSWIR